VKRTPLNLKLYCVISICIFTHHDFALSTQLEADGNVHISGYLNMTEYEDFVKLLAAKKIRTVTFKDCFGGNGLAGLGYAKKIYANHIKTIASGTVASACSFAYLGGRSRTLETSSQPKVIQFHGGFDAASLLPKGVAWNEKLLGYFSKDINFHFGKTLTEIILNTTRIDEGVYFVVFVKNNVQERLTFYCDGKDTSYDFAKCKKIDGMTLESEGIVTND
jgi:hypothetical protein